MDPELRFREHIANAATKALTAAMALRRLRMTLPSTARQFFGARVAPVIDYASNIGSHACGSSAMAALNRLQRTGAQVIAGVFRTVATVIGEAGANIPTVRERHPCKAAAFCVKLRMLARTNPCEAPYRPVLEISVSAAKNRWSVPPNSHGGDGVYSTIHNRAVGRARASAHGTR